MTTEVSAQLDLATAGATVSAARCPPRNFITESCAALRIAAIAERRHDPISPFIDVIAVGAPVDVDESKLNAGGRIVTTKRCCPIIIVNRTSSSLRTLQAASLLARLSDVGSVR
jgi:hypothetical protein